MPRAVAAAAACCMLGCNALLAIEEPTTTSDSGGAQSSTDGAGDVSDTPPGPFVCSVDGAPQDGPPPPPGTKRVVFQGTSNSSSFSNSIDVDDTGRGLLGDFEWLTIFSYFSETAVIPPGDWKERGLFTALAQNYVVTWWYRFASIGDPATWTFKLQRDEYHGSGQNFAALVRYSNVDPADPFEHVTTAPSTPLGFYTPSIETSRPGLLVVASFVNGDWGVGPCSPEPPLCTRLNTPAILLGDYFREMAGPTPRISPGCKPTDDNAVVVLALHPSP
jgi:hypothetical protein